MDESWAAESQKCYISKYPVSIECRHCMLLQITVQNNKHTHKARQKPYTNAP